MIPRPINTDAYTVCSYLFESPQALEQSSYAITFRRKLYDINPDLFTEGDNRIIFYGLSEIIKEIFTEPITHKEIDEAKAFLEKRKYSTGGFRDFEFPEKLWRDIVDKYNGRIPIRIDAVKEGEVVYPGEAVVRVTNTVSGYGTLAAWCESLLLQIWATTELATNCRHWLENQVLLVNAIESGEICFRDGKVSKGEGKLSNNKDINLLIAQSRLHNFGARAGICSEESARLSMVHLLCFNGTDTFSGAYLAYKLGADSSVGSSIHAHSHRSVAGFTPYHQAYTAIYDVAQDGDLISEVGDLVDYKRDLREYLIPLALDAAKRQNGKIIVARPDSGDPIDMVIYTIKEMEKAGLFTIGPNGFKYPTNMRIIQGDSMDWATITKIDLIVLNMGWACTSVIVYGMGGHLRNSIKRDNLSAKYYLESVGKEASPRVKFSDTSGKRSLPAHTVCRDEEALKTGITILSRLENREDALVNYYNGLSDQPFGPGTNDDFMTIRNRVLNEFNKMPLAAGKLSEHFSKEYSSLKALYGK